MKVIYPQLKFPRFPSKMRAKDSFTEKVSNHRRRKFYMLLHFIHEFCCDETFKTFLIPNKNLVKFGKVSILNFEFQI